ncbi:hypothetical protein [Helicobacter suis]|uniref:hypothetical protein n=1 Tax=Helicobacter suis TaxID=104628 RepID=UPI00030C8352|nr:hypothetical protein [Helicobacter suis]
MESLQLYQSVLHFFLDPTQTLLSNLGTQILELPQFSLFCNLCMVLALMLWAYQRIRTLDFFKWKTLFSLASFALFFTLFNYAIHHPQDFYTELKHLIFYPANTLTELIHASLKASASAFNLEETHLDLEFLINQNFHTLVLLISQIKPINSETLISVMLILALVISQGILLIYILALTVMVSIELYLWLALAIFILPLGLFGLRLLGLYFKKCLVLSFYQPLIILIAFYNAKILITLITNIPPTPLQSPPPLIENYFILIASTLLTLFLTKRIPIFINGLFGTKCWLADLATISTASKNLVLQHTQSFFNPSTSVTKHTTHTVTQENLKQEPSFSIQTLSTAQIQIQNASKEHL